MEDLSLKKYSVKNFQGVDFICIEPDADSVFIIVEGENEAGKTAFLDAMYIILCGGELPKNPIREGEEEAEIFVDLGSYTVKRILKRGAKQQPGIELRKKDGDVSYKIEKPRQILQNMINKYTLDPVEISEMKNEELAEMLKNACGLDVIKEDAIYDEEYNKRRDINRDLDSNKQQIKQFLGLPEIPKGRSEEEIQKNIDDCEEANDEIDDKEKFLAEKRKKLEQYPEEMEKLKTEFDLDIKDYEKQIEDLKNRIEEKGKKVASKFGDIERYKVELEDSISKVSQELTETKKFDTAPLKEEIKKARDYEAVKFKFERKKELDTEIKEFESAVLECEHKMKDAKDLKAGKIANAKLPEGIVFDGNSVFYNGNPFEQQSQARRIRIAVEIAALMNPKIRIMRIENGNAILEPMWEEISKIAKEFNFKILVESCVMNASGKKNSFFIKDGKLSKEGGDK